MSFSTEYILKLRDAFSQTMNRAADAMERLDHAAEQLNQRMERQASGLSNLGGKVTDMGKSMAARISAPILGVAGLAIKAAADLEDMQVSFEVMLGSADKAKKLTADLTKFGQSTPFEMPGIQDAARQLLASGVQAEEMTTKLTAIGDVASGANVPIEEMASIFAKVKMKGKAMTEELMQLAERGVPIVDVLGKHFKMTGAQVLDAASKGKITADVMDKAFAQMSGKGGIFFGMMDKRSKTMTGLMSTMSDEFRGFLADLGGDLQGNFGLKQMVVDVTNAVHAFRTWFTGLSPEAKKFGLYALAIAAALPLILIPLGMMISAMSALAPIISGIGAAIGFLLSPVGLVIAGLVLFYFAVKAFFDAFGDTIFGAIDSAITIITKGWDAITTYVTNGVVGFMDMLGAISGAIYSAVGSVVDYLVARVQALWAMMTGLGQAVSSLLSGDLDAALSKGKEALVAGVTAVTGVNLSGSAAVDINIKDRGGNVASAKGSSSGVGLNLGYNMQ